MCKPRRGPRVSHTLGLPFPLAQELDAGLRAPDVERREAQTSKPPSKERECLLCKGHFSEVAFCLAGFFFFKECNLSFRVGNIFSSGHGEGLVSKSCPTLGTP